MKLWLSSSCSSRRSSEICDSWVQWELTKFGVFPIFLDKSEMPFSVLSNCFMSRFIVFIYKQWLLGLKHHLSGFSCWLWFFLFKTNGRIRRRRYIFVDASLHVHQEGIYIYLFFTWLFPNWKLYKFVAFTVFLPLFVMQWFSDHPQFLSNPFYVAGDSYAGKVVPLIAQIISEGKLILSLCLL